MLRIAALIVMLATPTAAQTQADIEEPLLSLLDQYGGHLGALSACNRGPGKSAISAQAEKIGNWHLPGWWAGINGSRDDYIERITLNAEFEYSLNVLGGCTGAGELAGGLLIGEIETAIDRYTRQP